MGSSRYWLKNWGLALLLLGLISLIGWAWEQRTERSPAPPPEKPAMQR